MYRYQLEKYRGRSTRHVCPQCALGSETTFQERKNFQIFKNIGILKK